VLAAAIAPASGRKRRAAVAVSAWVSWCWRPLTATLPKLRSPSSRLADVQRHPIVAVTGFFRPGTTLSNAPSSNNLRVAKESCLAVVEVTAITVSSGPPMKRRNAKAQEAGVNFSHFGPEANVFDQARRGCSAPTAKQATAMKATTCISPEEAASTTAGLAPALIPCRSLPWEPISPDTDVLFSTNGLARWRGGEA